MQLTIQTFENTDQGKIELKDELFQVPFRRDIIARVIRWQMAKRQSGNHATKIISQISGTTKKPYKQKGTGQARHGSLRSPQFRGGAVIFGPVPRSHAHDLPKKIRQLGLRSAISQKVTEQKLHVFHTLEISEGKTAALKSLMAGHNIGNALFVGSKEEAINLKRSIGNLKGFDFLPIEGLNVLDIVKKDHIIIGKSSIEALEGRLQP